MGIKRYTANKDTTITNAFKQNLRTRGTGSNMGASDIVEVFSIYGQSFATGTYSGQESQEISRGLFQFPVSGSSKGQIKYDRTNGTIPASGSVDFYLRLHNAKHSQTLPRNATYMVQAVSQSWSEGNGLDMDEYKDDDVSNWVYRKDSDKWGKIGGEYHSASYHSTVNRFPTYTTTLANGNEDIELNITSMVEEWLSGPLDNFGLSIRLTGSQEAFFSSSNGLDVEPTILNNLAGAKKSYYTKKFFARGTQYFFKRPVIEARWDSSNKDDRGRAFYSSSLAPSADNLNTLYLYNFINGQLKNIPEVGTGVVYMEAYSGSADNSEPSTQLIQFATGTMMKTEKFYVTGGHHETGIYTASFALTASSINLLSRVFDVWTAGSGSNKQYFTGSFTITKRNGSEINISPKYVTKITNLKSSYKIEETPKLRLYCRPYDWSPTIYSKASTAIENTIVDDAYYKVYRIYDNETAIQYGTGSDNLDYTRLSYDVSGNYFDLTMNLLEADAMYAIKLSYYINGEYREQPEIFKFRVEK